jgi:hypothetical protein
MPSCVSLHSFAPTTSKNSCNHARRNSAVFAQTHYAVLHAVSQFGSNCCVVASGAALLCCASVLSCICRLMAGWTSSHIHLLHTCIAPSHCCVLWLCLCVLYRPSQPSSAAWYFAVISDIINNTSVIIVYCFGLLAAIGAEVVASSAPRATLAGGNAETIATLWVRGGAALVTLMSITLISVKVSSTSVNTVNITSTSDQPDQKTRHDNLSCAARGLRS